MTRPSCLIPMWGPINAKNEETIFNLNGVYVSKEDGVYGIWWFNPPDEDGDEAAGQGIDEVMEEVINE